MSAEEYSLSWDSYKSNICNGFAELQQKQELVDMTLVAEGHLVKVHKNLICLASPYIKQTIIAAPCKHPIIFLNNVSHETLCYLLEYIYTGEVKVQEDKLETLLNAANDLKLCGLEKLSQKKSEQPFCVLQKEAVDKGSINELTISNNGTCQYTAQSEHEHGTLHSYHETSEMYMIPDELEHVREPADARGAGAAAPDAGPRQAEEPRTDIAKAITIDSTGCLPQQYSVSNRGSLQLIWNRFIYYMHHQALCGRKRRWRCIDYRRSRCPAFVDTFAEAITLRYCAPCAVPSRF